MLGMQRQTPTKGMMRGSAFALAVLASLSLSSCATMRMHMRYGALQSDTKVSESIFLELRTKLPPTVYLAEAAATDPTITVRPFLDQALTASGYAVVGDPDSATYVLQINHRQFIETELSADQTLGDVLSGAFSAGFGTAIAVDVLGGSGDAAAGLGLAVGVVSFIADAHTKHIAHVLTTDIRLTETVPVADGLAGLNALYVPVTAPRTRREHHEVQIASGASKVNLNRGESQPAIVRNLTDTIIRLLPAQPPAST
jgi:hypothetical protein